MQAMSKDTQETAVRASVLRHVIVSVLTAVAIFALVLIGRSALSPAGIAAIAVGLAAIVCGIAMHLYREERAVQALIGFTVLFIVAMVGLMTIAVDDVPDGVEIVRYDEPASPDSEEAH